MSYLALLVSPLQMLTYSDRAQTWRKPQEDHIALEFSVLADVCNSSVTIFIATGSSRAQRAPTVL